MQTTRITILVFFLGLFLTGMAFGQAPDRVELKDGGFVQGTIIEYLPDSHIRIKTEEGTVHEFKASEIAKLRNKKVKEVPVKRRGYYNNTSFGLLLGNTGYNIANASLQMANGYQFGRFQVGVGSGLETFDYNLHIPAFAEFRYFFRDASFSPFVSTSLGYNWQVGQNYRYDPTLYPEERRIRTRGMLSGIGMGIRNYPTSNFGYMLGVGYRYQGLQQDAPRSFWNGNDQIGYWVQERTIRHRIEVRFGILFN